MADVSTRRQQPEWAIRAEGAWNRTPPRSEKRQGPKSASCAFNVPLGRKRTLPKRRIAALPRAGSAKWRRIAGCRASSRADLSGSPDQRTRRSNHGRRFPRSANSGRRRRLPNCRPRDWSVELACRVLGSGPYATSRLRGQCLQGVESHRWPHAEERTFGPDATKRTPGTSVEGGQQTLRLSPPDGCHAPKTDLCFPLKAGHQPQCSRRRLRSGSNAEGVEYGRRGPGLDRKRTESAPPSRPILPSGNPRS
jgi:hypothetical protein